MLYAPAWDAGGSLRCVGEQVIEQVLSLDDVNVIVKLHPISYTPRTSSNFESYAGGVDWVKRFRRFESNPRFRHITNHVSELATAAARWLANLEEGSHQRRQLAGKLLYNPGKGADAAATAILEMLV